MGEVGSMNRSRFRLPARARLSALLAALATIALALAPAASAEAAVKITCQASAVSLGVLGQQPLAPVTAGAPDDCPTEQGVPTVAIPDLLTASVLVAETGRGGDDKNPSATAAAGLASARLSLLPDTLPLVTTTVETAIESAIAAVEPVSVDLGLLGIGTIDLQDGLRKLKPTAFTGELVAADALPSRVALSAS